jgi:hypothetical protein
MLSDYANTIPAIIAIANSMISVGIAHFKPERTWLKVVILAISIILGLAAAAATVYGQHEIVRVQQEEKTRRADIHKMLGNFIASGNVIMLSLRDQSKPVDLEGANTWASAVEGYLAKALPPGYVPRFRDGSGIVHGEPMGIDVEHQNVWNGIYERIARLEQFSSEVP